MLIVDAQIHLWEKGTPSAHHRQEPYSAEQAIAGMDAAGVDRALIHPVLWDPDSNELAVEAVRKYPDRFAIMCWFYLDDPNVRDLVARWKERPGMLGLRFYTNERHPLNDGLDTLSLAAYLGHANIQNIKRYAKMNAPALTACGATKNGCAHHVASYPLFVPLAWCVSAGDGGVRMDATRVADGCLSRTVRSAGAIVVFGMLTFASGLAIVLGHNDWSNNPAQVVSLLGWLMTIKGAALLLIPATGWKAFLSAVHYPSHPVLDTIIPGLVGAYLIYAGFVRR